MLVGFTHALYTIDSKNQIHHKLLSYQNADKGKLLYPTDQ